MPEIGKADPVVCGAAYLVLGRKPPRGGSSLAREAKAQCLANVLGQAGNTITRSPARCPFTFSAFTVSLFGEGSPTKIDYRKKVGTRILSSLLDED